MKRRGLYTACAGTVLFGVSLLAANSVAESNFMGPAGFDVSSIFDGMFDMVTDEITIIPGATERVSFAVESDGVPVIWAVHMTDYEPGDSLSIAAYGPSGNAYGRSTQIDEVTFEAVEQAREGPVDIEITNTGPEPVTITVMFSEDPENSEMFMDPDSPLNKLIFPLVIAGAALIAGLVVVIAGIVIFLMDMRRQQRVNRFDDWSSGR